MLAARMLGLILILAAAPCAIGQQVSPSGDLLKANRQADPAVLARRIDLLLEKAFKAAGVQPAPPADDAEFLRRAYLDITGRIPRPADVHAFIADTKSDKRRRLIDELLAEPRHTVHFA